MTTSQQVKIPWWQPQVGEEEKKRIISVLKSNYLNEGKVTEEFEQKIASFLGMPYAVATTSGTSALFLALKACGVGFGDEVIVPDITFIATANAVHLSGATPVLADVDRRTFNLCVETIDRVRTKKTKAIIPVHVSGRASPMEAILEYSQQYNIFVIEDAAEAFGSKHNGRYLGTYGKLGCFSFSPNKTITTGQGGIVVARDPDLAKRLKELKDQGRPVRGTGGDDIHASIGYNFKMTDLQAAVGLVQLGRLESRHNKLVQIYKHYKETLYGISGIEVINFDVENGERPQWVDAISFKKNELVKYLLERGIQCRNFWFPIHHQKPYKQSDESFLNSIFVSKNAFWLPSAFTLEIEEINMVCNAIREFFLSN